MTSSHLPHLHIAKQGVLQHLILLKAGCPGAQARVARSMTSQKLADDDNHKMGKKATDAAAALDPTKDDLPSLADLKRPR